MRFTSSPTEEQIAKRLSPSQLSVLLRVSSALASSLDLQDVLQASVESVVEVLGLDTGAIYLLDGDALYLGATTPPLDPAMPEELRHAVLDDHPRVRQSVDTSSVVFLDDARDAELSPAEKVVVDARGLRTVLYAPLMLDGEAIGAFIVGTTGSVHTFSNDDVDLCQVLSSQIALAVANARLHESVVRANAEIMRINANLEMLVDERTEELALANAELSRQAEELQSQAEQLEEHAEELGQAAEARARSLRALGHEFRTPLNVIVGIADNLMHGISGDISPEVHHQAERIAKAGNHLLSISDEVLDLARIDAGVIHLVFEPISLRALVDEVLGAVAEQAADKELMLTHHLPKDLPKLVSDKTRVRQILLNLLTNAVKYTDSGTVSVDLARPDDEHVTISVTDTGPGIPTARREAIFREFSHDYSSKAETEGLGLGLAISRRLAAALGGRLTLETQLGEGSTLSLTLPLSPEQRAG